MSNTTPSSKVVTPVSCRELSSSLKERLKRCGRYHSSPSAAKRLCTTPDRKDDAPSLGRECTPKTNTKWNVSKGNTPENVRKISSDAEKARPRTEFATPDKGGVLLKTRAINTETEDNESVTKNVHFNELEERSMIYDEEQTTQTPVSVQRHFGSTNKYIAHSPRTSVCTPVPRSSSRNSSKTFICTPEQMSGSITKRSHIPVTPLSSQSRHLPKMRTNRLNFGSDSPQAAKESGGCNEPDGESGCSKKGETNECEIMPTTSNVNIQNTADRSDVGDTKMVLENTKSEKKIDVRQNLITEKRRLTHELAEKSEILRKLKMVKFYREKNNLTDLKRLIEKWKDISQQGLQNLHDSLPEPKPTMSALINHLQIDSELIIYNEDEETFL